MIVRRQYRYSVYWQRGCVELNNVKECFSYSVTTQAQACMIAYEKAGSGARAWVVRENCRDFEDRTIIMAVCLTSGFELV
jgi:hypothetical protein